MKLIIEATPTIERVNGLPARVWKGKTESGIEVTCWIPIVQVRRDTDNSEFERELKEIGVNRQIVSFDMRMIVCGGQFGHAFNCAIFKCSVCGTICDTSPDHGPAFCPLHCPDHDYRHERGEGHRCVTCGAPPPDNWFDVG